MYLSLYCKHTKMLIQRRNNAMMSYIPSWYPTRKKYVYYKNQSFLNTYQSDTLETFPLATNNYLHCR